jgi:hypothetical protein
MVLDSAEKVRGQNHPTPNIMVRGCGRLEQTGLVGTGGFYKMGLILLYGAWGLKLGKKRSETATIRPGSQKQEQHEAWLAVGGWRTRRRRRRRRRAEAKIPQRRSSMVFSSPWGTKNWIELLHGAQTWNCL